MGVGVHEPGAHHQAVGVDHLGRLAFGQVAHRHDETPGDGHVGRDPRSTGAVHHSAPTDHHVEHGARLSAAGIRLGPAR